jgi:hypothetical protein
MARVYNLSPSHRPPQPSLNNGRVQKRIRRAYVATGLRVMSGRRNSHTPWFNVRLGPWSCRVMLILSAAQAQVAPPYVLRAAIPSCQRGQLNAKP